MGLTDGANVIGVTGSFIFFGVLDPLMGPFLSLAILVFACNWGYRKLSIAFSDSRPSRDNAGMRKEAAVSAAPVDDWLIRYWAHMAQTSSMVYCFDTLCNLLSTGFFCCDRSCGCCGLSFHFRFAAVILFLSLSSVISLDNNVIYIWFLVHLLLKPFKDLCPEIISRHRASQRACFCYYTDLQGL